MTIKSTFITLDSNKNIEIMDITSVINQKLDDFEINEGLVNIFTKHSTSAIVINENESGLLKDFEFTLNTLIDDNYSYHHDKIDNNASSHLKSFLLSSSQSIPIKNSRLDLGTWQSVFFLELDGPRSNRQVNLTIIY